MLRTHNCGTLDINNVGDKVTLSGWVQKTRDLGGMTFIDLRDRYGIKPLYYSLYGDLFLFGSEQRAILSHPKFKFEVDKKGLIEYFTFQNFFTNRTLTKGIKILEAASIAKIEPNKNNLIHIKKYCLRIRY